MNIEKKCADCHETSDLRFVRLLTAPNCYLCNDAQGCRERTKQRLSAS